MARLTRRRPTKKEIARAYADGIVLSGIARVSSTLRLGELSQQVSEHGIGLADLRNLLATNPDRYAYDDRRWVPKARVDVAEGPINELLRQTLRNYAAPMPISDLAAELSATRGRTKEHFEANLPAMLIADPDLFATPSGYAGLAVWMFVARDETIERAMNGNGLTEEDVKEWARTLGRVDFSNVRIAAERIVKYAPVSAKVIGYFAWKQLNPQDPYALRLYDATELFDALLMQEGLVFGADGRFHTSADAPRWLRQALREAEKTPHVIDVEEVAPLEFGKDELEEMLEKIMGSDISLSVGELLREKYDLTPADRTYPEDVANAVTSLRKTKRVWYVGGDRLRAPDSAPEFIYSVPKIFEFHEWEYLDEDGEAIDVELSDDGFSSALRKETAHLLSQDVQDEDPQPQPKTMPDSLRLVVKAHHREIGTFPLCQIPPGWLDPDPKIQELIFIDRNARELNVWLNHDARLMFNLLEWWFEQPVESGAVFTLTKTDRANVFEFAWVDETDPLLYISSERMEALRDLAARSAELSTYEVLMEVLGHYRKGADFVTLLAEMNVVRRVTRRLVASVLTGYHCFYQRSGSPVWHYDAKKVQQGFDRAKRKHIRG
ncbi:MAG: hypothetical protein IH851_01730 [Armatimonadetes bacterium]|nr:hypothetical protein [Armatimonadota bacterium]